MGTRVAIIDYQAGNLTSCLKGFEHVAQQQNEDISVEIVTSAEALTKATHIVLPGQGAFGDCASQLRKIDAMVDTLERLVLKEGRPFFGICVGMQLLANRGLEFGETQGLGWIEGEVVALEPQDQSLKIPHMGWNDLIVDGKAQQHPLMQGVETGDHAYFVHSFHFKQADKAHLLAEADYGGPVTAIIGKDNIFGTQFHPEKSQALGLKLIDNFLSWRP